MKVSLRWLREYVNVKLPPQELAERLTMAGLEVGAVEVVGGQWQGGGGGGGGGRRPTPTLTACAWPLWSSPERPIPWCVGLPT